MRFASIDNGITIFIGGIIPEPGSERFASIDNGTTIFIGGIIPEPGSDGCALHRSIMVPRYLLVELFQSPDLIQLYSCIKLIPDFF
jgi:hypothetical protein